MDTSSGKLAVDAHLLDVKLTNRYTVHVPMSTSGNIAKMYVLADNIVRKRDDYYLKYEANKQ